jgi:hypothetical protein
LPPDLPLEHPGPWSAPDSGEEPQPFLEKNEPLPVLDLSVRVQLSYHTVSSGDGDGDGDAGDGDRDVKATVLPPYAQPSPPPPPSPFEHEHKVGLYKLNAVEPELENTWF